jgi:CDP-diacylglycerol---glycerol-3-phosphate 3-phosphatidyltransferase
MLAHYLTFARLVLGPVFAYCFYYSMGCSCRIGWQWASLGILALIELTDAFDGRVARGRGEVTDFGKFFDPLADSVSRLAIFLGFLMAGIIPLWMFLVFLYRDGLVSAIRYMCIIRGVVVPARVSGKLKAIFQAIGSFAVVSVCIAHAIYPALVPGTILGRPPAYFIMLLPALFTAYSLFDYAYGNRMVLRQSL